MSKIKFTPEMFFTVSENFRDQAAYAAQQIYDEYVAKAPVVYGFGATDGAPWARWNENGGTHTARLIEIEPIENKKCEHEPVIVGGYEIPWKDAPWECARCGVRLNATWSEL